MKRVRLLSGLLSAGMLSFTLATVGAQVAQAQRPINIFELSCVGRWGRTPIVERQDVSIGRELYTSILKVDTFGFTCKLPGGPASLRFEYGVTDSDKKPPAKIEVYVDGNQVASQIGKEGRVNTMLVDVSNGKSLAIDINCSRATNCGDPYNNGFYYFFSFHLIPGATSPGRR